MKKLLVILISMICMSAYAMIDQEKLRYKDGGPTDLPPGVKFIGSNMSAEEKNKLGFRYLTKKEIQEIKKNEKKNEKNSIDDVSAECVGVWDERVHSEEVGPLHDRKMRYFYKFKNLTHLVKKDTNKYSMRLVYSSHIKRGDGTIHPAKSIMEDYEIETKGEFDFGLAYEMELQKYFFWDRAAIYTLNHNTDVYVVAVSTPFNLCPKRYSVNLKDGQFPPRLISHS
jgi:hypothetical protein